MLWLKPNSTLVLNRWRYLSFIAGFFLFVAPFAFLVRATLFALGKMQEPTLHVFCYRMPIDWIFGGRYSSLIASSVSTGFIVVILASAFLFGPLFCGWLCPVGSISESASRVIPLPGKYRIWIKDTQITSGLRYGFLVGFIAIAVLVGYKLAASDLSSICCRYCTSSVLQNLSSGLFGNFLAIEYWHTGAIIVLISWLLIGGVFMQGGRGWCLFFCPLGALSNVVHKVGARLGLYRIEHSASKCASCNSCSSVCPTWAIKDDKTIERSLCIACKECVNVCPNGCYSYQKGFKK